MAHPVIVTKLGAPSATPGLVTRPRLLQRLRDGADARLTLVSAPAGFGKTTLVAEWLRACAGTPADRYAGTPADRYAVPSAGTSAGTSAGPTPRVAWLSLERSEDEPTAFWAHVLAALEGVVPGLGRDLTDIVGTPGAGTQALVLLVNELAAAPEQIRLVLDDYHVITNRDVTAGMALLLDHLPPTVRVVICTRSDPDLALARWRARGELLEVRADDLRFTDEEASAYLRTAGLDLAPQDIAALAERTEGWAAALQLAALSLRGRADPGAFIARFAGDDRYVVDYLAEEALAHLSAADREFLLVTAVLDRLCGDLCDAVTGRSDGARTLVELERAGLFVIALDDQRRWFRYHHLFADVLRARLIADAPERVPELHRRASAWYAGTGRLSEAIRHALAGGDNELAARLIERAVPQVRRDRAEAALRGWLAALPVEIVDRSPILSVYAGFFLMTDGAFSAAQVRLVQAERALARAASASAAPAADASSDGAANGGAGEGSGEGHHEGSDEASEELRTLPATIAVYRASIALARGDGADTETHARRALELAGPLDHLSRGGALGFLGIAAWTRGDVHRASATFEQAVAALRAAGNVVDELSGTVVLADLALAAGRPERARRLYERALRRAEALGSAVARATAELHVGMSELDYEANDLVGAKEHLEAAAVLAEHAPMTESRYRWFVAMARVTAAEGDAEEATALLDEAQRLFQPGFFPDVRPVPAIRARLWIAHGELSRALSWAADREEGSALNEYEELTLVRLHLARHREGTRDALDGVDRILDRLLATAEAQGRSGSAQEIGMLQALVLDARGRRAQAVDRLAAVVAAMPDPDARTRLFLDEGPAMTDLLRAAPAGNLAERAGRLLPTPVPAATGRTMGGHALGEHGASALVEALSPRELEVLRLLDTELRGPEIARHLFVSYNTLRTHTKHIFTKLDVTTRRAALARARELLLL